MRRGDAERLNDIAEAIRAIRSHVARGARKEDRRTRDAVLYNLMIIGEAVKGLSEEARALRPTIPWRQIAGLRDLLTHEYFRVDMSEVVKIVERELGPLDDAVSALRADTLDARRARGLKRESKE